MKFTGKNLETVKEALNVYVSDYTGVAGHDTSNAVRLLKLIDAEKPSNEKEVEAS